MNTKVTRNSYYLRRKLLQQSSKTRKEIYLAGILTLTRSLVIKSDDVADQIHHTDKMNRPDLYDSQTPRSQYRYFQHLAGEYTPTDTPMEIFSLDSQSIVAFDKDIRGHALTHNKLTEDRKYLKVLLAKYPTQERLVNGILNPILPSVSVHAEDFTILYHNTKYVEDNEFSLMDKLQTYVTNMNARWKIRPYANLDEYYFGLHESMVALSIVPKLINLREEVLHTIEAHSFHVSEYLISNGVNTELVHLNKAQWFFLYKNIKYIKKHAGNMKTFLMMVKGLVEPAGIPLDTHIVTHKHKTDGTIEPIFFSTPLVENARSYGKRVKTLEEYEALERSYRQSNASVPHEVTNRKVLLGRYGRNNAKLLESSLDDSAKVNRVTELQLILSYMAYLTSENHLKYTYISSAGRIDIRDTIGYFSVLTALLRGEVPNHVPEHIEVEGIVSNNNITKEEYPDLDIPDKYLAYLNTKIFKPTQYSSKKIFLKDIALLFSVYEEVGLYIRGIDNPVHRVNMINLFNSLWSRRRIDLPNGGDNLTRWLTERNLEDPRGRSRKYLTDALDNLLKTSTDHTLSRNLRGNQQKATIETLMMLSSYSISCSYQNANRDEYAFEYSSARFLDVGDLENSVTIAAPMAIDLTHNGQSLQDVVEATPICFLGTTRYSTHLSTDFPTQNSIQVPFTFEDTGVIPVTHNYDIITPGEMVDNTSENINESPQSLVRLIKTI